MLARETSLRLKLLRLIMRYWNGNGVVGLNCNITKVVHDYNTAENVYWDQPVANAGFLEGELGYISARVTRANF